MSFAYVCQDLGKGDRPKGQQKNVIADIGME